MRKFLISAALVASAAVAAPVAAQNYDRYYDARGGQQINQQLNNLVQRIDRAYQRRLISPNEARSLRERANDIGRRYDRYRRNGISRGEHDDLQRRIQNLRHRLQEERFEGREDRREDRRDDRRDRRW